MSRLRFGVVGCGAIATVYQLPALRRSRALDVVAVTDLDEDWARRVARRHGVASHHRDYRALFGAVDAALVATPNATHADITCALLEQGIHVLCEKPMATTRAEVERMLAASARSGARVMAAHCLRFSPNLVLLKELVTGGTLGAVREISAGIGGAYDPGRTDFRRQKRLSGGGVLVDLGIHLIDLAVWLAGAAPVAVAYDEASAPGWEVETDAEVVLDFPGRARATLAASFTQPLEPVLTVRGTAGWARAPLYDPTELTFFSERARVCRRDGAQRFVLPNDSMYVRQLDHFCAAVTSGGDFVVRPEHVLAGVDVIARCYGERAAAA